jgi:hypothetical protein
VTVRVPDLVEGWRTPVLGAVLGIVLVALGLLIWPAGHTLAKCPGTSTDFSLGGVAGGLLVVSDGCNHYEIPLLTVLGGLLVVLAVGFAIVSAVRRRH